MTALLTHGHVTGLTEATFAPRPDYEGDGEVAPHPDGRAWAKACPECAFRTGNPQGYTLGALSDLRQANPDTHYYCVHRVDGNHHRVCACYAAIRIAEARCPLVRERGVVVLPVRGR